MLDSQHSNPAYENDPLTMRADSTLAGVHEREEGSCVGEALAEGIYEGEFIPGYEFLSELGRGGMGVVYKARDRSLKRLVAIKMIRSGADAGKAARLRFQAEAEAVAQLHHNHIVDIFEVGEHDNMPYIVFELIDGGSLKDQVAGKPKRATYGASLVESLASAVQVAHEHDIIHRDLKPSNVLLDVNGAPRITDFGLAKQKNNDLDDTRVGTVLGTPAYMSPEQASVSSDKITPATDIYALGSILYYILTGRPPFQSANDIDTLFHVVHSQPISPRKLSPTIPVDLETICLKCLEKDPERRFHSASELADDLRRFLDGRPVTAKPASRLRKAGLWVRRSPYKAISLTLFTVFLGTLIWFQEHLLTIAELEREKEVERNVKLQTLTDNAIQEAERADQQALFATENEEAAAEATELAIRNANRALDAEYRAILQLITNDIQMLNYEAANRRINEFSERISHAEYDPTGAEWSSLTSIAKKFYHRIPLGNNVAALGFAYSEHQRLIACLSRDAESMLRLHLVDPFKGELVGQAELLLESVVDNSPDGPRIHWIDSNRILLGASSGLYAVSIYRDSESTEVKMVQLTTDVVLDVVKHPQADAIFVARYGEGESPGVVVHRWEMENKVLRDQGIVFSSDHFANVSRLAIDKSGAYLGLSIGDAFQLMTVAGELLGEVRSHTRGDGTIKSVCFLSNGTSEYDQDGLAVAFAGHHKLVEVYEFSMETAALKIRQRFRPHLGMIQSITNDPNSGGILSAANDKMISCTRPFSGERLFILQEHEAEILQASSMKDGEFIVSSSLDGVLIIRKRLVAHQEIRGLSSKSEANLTNPILLNDDRYALATHTSFRNGNGDVVLFDLDTREVIQRHTLPGTAAIGCCNQKGDVVVIPVLDGSIGIVRYKEGTIDFQLADASQLPGEPIKALAAVFSPLTHSFYVSLLLETGTTVIARLSASSTTLEVIDHYVKDDAQRPPLLGLSSNGQLLISLSREVGVSRQHLRMVRLAGNIEGRRLVGSIDIPFDAPTRHLAVLDLPTLAGNSQEEASRVFVALEGPVVEELLIQADGNGSLQFRRIGEYTGHYIDVRTLLLSADGRRLSSFGLDGCFCTWHIPEVADEGDVHIIEPLIRWQLQLQRYGGIYLRRRTGELVLSYDKGVAVIPWERGYLESQFPK
ncbi:MAG: hypothetical protein CMM02_00165 [Rhodopirellula sp.]|nr:hypothetical protein [Rhodopirellula sp.]